MAVQTDLGQKHLRAIGRRALAACVASALASHVAHLEAGNVASVPADTRFVTNCDDHGPGSLRAVLAEAVNFDTVSLAGLSCSLITLTTGELSTDLDDITLTGDATISAGGNSRVLSHHGSGTLSVFGLEFADGYAVGNPVRGGCIHSLGNVELRGVTVHDCQIFSPAAFSSFAAGGGVFATGDAIVSHSSIVDNAVHPGAGQYSSAHGGGIFADGNLTLSFATISGNIIGGNSVYQSGGGLSSRSSVSIGYSTISTNSAYIAGAAEFGAGAISEIRNSTISGNTAVYRTGGIVTFDGLLQVRNSTISLNTAQRGFTGGGAGILALGFAEYLSLHSSIIALNTAAGAEDDVCATFSPGGLIGEANLILTANIALPDDTIRSDPMLVPLAHNGGSTLTHALLPGSPAIDAGNNGLFLPYDQREIGFPRVSGNRADIGAFELQQPEMPDRIFTSDFE